MPDRAMLANSWQTYPSLARWARGGTGLVPDCSEPGEVLLRSRGRMRVYADICTGPGGKCAWNEVPPPPRTRVRKTNDPARVYFRTIGTVIFATERMLALPAQTNQMIGKLCLDIVPGEAVNGNLGAYF